MLTLIPFFLQVEVASEALLILGIISLLAGILIFVVPRVLNYIVAAYLVVIGILWIIASLD